MEILMTPEDYINSVDEMYLECKAKKLSRFSDDWDTFSRKINKERLEIVKSSNSEKDVQLFNQCLSYWFNRSELLELHTKNKLLSHSKRKKLAKEGKKIRKDILDGKVDTVLGTRGIVDMFAKHHRKMTPLKGAF